jgi:hypothetical protein
MRLVRFRKPRRPYRHAAPEDLLLLSIVGDRRVRGVIEHELDLRTLRRILRSGGRLTAEHFADDMPTGGRFAEQDRLDLDGSDGLIHQ